jgi:hypothetical protein
MEDNHQPAALLFVTLELSLIQNRIGIAKTQ